MLGEKLACDANGSSTYYRGGVMIYGSDDKLLYILTPEGTVARSEGSAGTSYTYNYFKKDHIGSTRAVLSAVDDTLQTVQSTDYYPFGLAFSTNNLNKNKYLFSGKELQDGNLGGSMLGLYDFGARHYDPMIGRWTTTDPLARKYIGLSPYNYCANNPARFMDPSGMTIDTLSEKEFASIWSSLRNDMLSTQNRLNTLNATDHEWQSIGMQNTIASLEMQIASIDYTMQTMNIMHSSSQLYSLNRIGPTDIGGLRLDVVSGRNAIVVSYGSISNFVHEAVHVRQFEEGRVAFSMSSGSPMLNDIYKEVEAYQIHPDYDPLSVQGLISSVGSIVSREGITPAWVQGLYDGNANQPYKPGGYAKTAEIALDRNSTLKDLIPAYPSMGLTYSPDVDLNANLFDYFNLYYKNGPIK